MSEIETCPGCGYSAPAIDGPVHACMTCSAACWQAFNTIMAREYSSGELMPTHFLSVDAFAAQHPGGRDERRALQSVWIHLAGLHAVLREGKPPQYRYDLLRRLADATREWPDQPEHSPFPIVAGNISPDLGVDEHIATMREWAEATLAAYEAATPDLGERLAQLAQ